jgi:type IX secretion system PorP/SprF family membrane protein
MKRIFTISIFCLAAWVARAQDEPTFSHYIINPTLMNPAMAGASGNQQLFVHYRSQFTGLTEGANTYAFSYNGRFGEKIGLGALVLNENIAALSRLRVQFSYVYLFGNKNFKGGISIAPEYSTIRLSDEALSNPMNEPDRFATEATKGLSYFDATVGFTGLVNDRFRFGLSLPNLVRARLGATSNVQKDTNFLRQFVLHGGYRITINDNFSIEPSLVLRKPFYAPFEAEFNAKASFLDDKLIAGLSYRPGSSGAIGVLAGFKYEGVQLYYTFAHSTSELGSYRSAGHELTFGIELSKATKKTGVPTPRKKPRYKK